MWGCVFDRIAGTNAITGLLATRQCVLRRWREPVRQDRERPMAKTADAPTHPYAVVPFVVSLPESTSMAHDGVVMANRTSPRQAAQRNSPGSMLSFVSASAIKRITAGVKARR